MLGVRFESGKKGGIVEKLFPFLAKESRKWKSKSNEKQYVIVQVVHGMQFAFQYYLRR